MSIRDCAWGLRGQPAGSRTFTVASSSSKRRRGRVSSGWGHRADRSSCCCGRLAALYAGEAAAHTSQHLPAWCPARRDGCRKARGGLGVFRDLCATPTPITWCCSPWKRRKRRKRTGWIHCYITQGLQRPRRSFPSGGRRYDIFCNQISQLHRPWRAGNIIYEENCLRIWGIELKST